MERKTIIKSTVSLIKVMHDLSQMSEEIISKMEIEIEELRCKNSELQQKLYFLEGQYLFNKTPDVEKTSPKPEPFPKNKNFNSCKVCGVEIPTKRVVCSTACRSVYAQKSRKIKHPVENTEIDKTISMADEIIGGLTEHIAISKERRAKRNESAPSPEVKPAEDESPGK